MPVKGKAVKKECKHKWEWLDCEEALVCTNEGCNAYTKDINMAPFGESTLLYRQREFYIKKLEEMNTKISKLDIWCGVGWALFVVTAILVELMRRALAASL